MPTGTGQSKFSWSIDQNSRIIPNTFREAEKAVHRIEVIQKLTDTGYYECCQVNGHHGFRASFNIEAFAVMEFGGQNVQTPVKIWVNDTIVVNLHNKTVMLIIRGDTIVHCHPDMYRVGEIIFVDITEPASEALEYEA